MRGIDVIESILPTPRIALTLEEMNLAGDCTQTPIEYVGVPFCGLTEDERALRTVLPRLDRYGRPVE